MSIRDGTVRSAYFKWVCQRKGPYGLVLNIGEFLMKPNTIRRIFIAIQCIAAIAYLIFEGDFGLILIVFLFATAFDFKKIGDRNSLLLFE